MSPKARVALPLLARCVRIWFSTGSLTVTALYLLAALAFRHPWIRAAPRWLTAAPPVCLALGLMGFDLPWAWTDVVDAIPRPVRVPQLVAARISESDLVVCPTCLGTGRDPEAPAAIADDDGTCPRCCDPRHPLYAAHHGHALATAGAAIVNGGQ